MNNANNIDTKKMSLEVENSANGHHMYYITCISLV